MNSFIFCGMSQHALSIYNAVTFSNNTETIVNYHFMHLACTVVVVVVIGGGGVACTAPSCVLFDG